MRQRAGTQMRWSNPAWRIFDAIIRPPHAAPGTKLPGLPEVRSPNVGVIDAGPGIERSVAIAEIAL